VRAGDTEGLGGSARASGYVHRTVCTFGGGRCVHVCVHVRSLTFTPPGRQPPQMSCVTVVIYT
jgi:hypothetical protein